MVRARHTYGQGRQKYYALRRKEGLIDISYIIHRTPHIHHNHNSNSHTHTPSPPPSPSPPPLGKASPSPPITKTCLMHQPASFLLLLLLLPSSCTAFLPPSPLLPSRPIMTKLSASTTSTHKHTHTLPGLVSTDWLHHHLDDEDLSILDIRGEVAKAPVSQEGKQATDYLALHSEYVDGHIPNSVFVDWTKDIAHTQTDTHTHIEVPVQLLPLEELRTAMEEKGVGLRKRVIIYDNGNLLFATRLWWALRLAGHEAVGVLDGGYAKWLAEDRPVSVDCPCPLKINEPWECESGKEATSLFSSEGEGQTQSDTHSQPPFLSARVEADFVLSSCVQTPSPAEVQIIDARSQEQYLGKVSRSLRGGHIPRALSVPYKELLAAPQQDAGTGLSYRVMKSREGLEETLRAAGVRVSVNDGGGGKDEGEKVPALTCVYCNGGVASTVVIFVLNQLYGMQTVNYDGSWNEWGKRGGLPVEV